MSKEVLTHSESYIKKTNRIILAVGITSFVIFLLGLKSIDSHITNAYHRIRLGVGHPKGVGEVVVNHVLYSI